YKYDDDGRRIEKEVNGQIIRYFYDGDSINPLYETNGSGEVLRQYVYSIDGVRLAMKAQGQTLFYHYNPRGDVIAMTDQNGQVVANYEYDAWGNVLKSDAKGIAAENPFGYAGYMYDKEIGMYYLIARYYNPEHGVFLSIDPDPGDEDDPVTQNGYTYGDNNPVMMVDPDGHLAWFAPLAIHGARIAAPHVARYAAKKGIKRATLNAMKKKPFQVHHFATNKSKKYTSQFQKISKKYDLDLDAGWNKKRMRHQGRHPNAYHEFMLRNMKKIDKQAKGDRKQFLRSYRSLRKHVQKNSDMLYSPYWKSKKKRR
ncbi:RHS repeat-associated core domain-containing protein, partial [Bacillus toyonensis]